MKLIPARFAVALALTAALAHAEDAAPLATFSCRERLGRDWRSTLVTYQLVAPGAEVAGPEPWSPGRVTLAQAFKPGAVRLLDDQGQEQPFQLWHVERGAAGALTSARLSFMAALPTNGAYCYRLVPGKPQLKTAGVAVDRSRKALTLDSGAVAIRLPPEGTVTFKKPLPFGSDHAAKGLAPGPLQGLRLADGRWVGGSYFAAADPTNAPVVLGYDCRIVEQGPLFTEAAIRYRFDRDRHYTLSVRLSPGSPAVWIDEQFDMGAVGHTRHWRAASPLDPEVRFSFAGAGSGKGAWLPDHAYWERQPYGNSVQPQNTPLQETLTARGGFDFKNIAYGTHRLPYDDKAGAQFGVEPWAVYGNYVFYCGLVNAAEVAAQTNAPFIGIMPVHSGNWRGDGPYQLKWLTTHKSGDVALHMPLAVFPHPSRAVHTGEFDTANPYMFGRRQWVLFGGPLQSLAALHAFRAYEGYINLDDYKDWALDWPADPAVTYPRMFFDRAALEKLRPTLSRHPFAADIGKWLYVNDDPALAASLYQRLSGDRGVWGSALGQINDGLNYWFTLWRQGHATGQWIGQVEELLASTNVTAVQKQTLRTQVAALCYTVSEPDFNPRGSMVHLGNPNMAIVRTLPLLYGATLVPDHPAARGWLDVSEQFVRYKLASNTGPGGGWSELFTYYDASAPALVHAANLLAGQGRLDPVTRRLALEVAQVPLAFIPSEDPRYGIRYTPSWGHEGRLQSGQWLPAANLAQPTDPAAARALLWGWQANGNLLGFHDSDFSRRCSVVAGGAAAIPVGEIRPALASTWVPSLGIVFRAHPGDPNETYFALRQGSMISHCDDNQGDFILFSKGAPLVDLCVMAYPLHQHEPYRQLNATFGWYSVPRLKAQNNASDMMEGSNNRNLVGAWNPSSDIHAHAFSDSVDYLRSAADYPPQRWTRQVLFLKGATAAGPNYFVFRDSLEALPGEPAPADPWWWNLRTVGSTSLVASAAGEMTYTSPFGTRLNVRLLSPAQARAESREASRPVRTMPHRRTWPGPGQPASDTNLVDTLAVTAFGPLPAGQPVLAVLYPQVPGEAAPAAEAVAEGVARIVTSEGTDWVFAAPAPFRFEQGDVAFAGRAGAVRLRGADVHLVIAEGPAEVRYKGLTLRSAVPATQVFEGPGWKPVAQDAQPAAGGTRDGHLARPFPSPAGTATTPAEGVQRSAFDGGFALQFDSPTTLVYRADGVVFEGTRGGLVVDEKQGTVRLVLLEGGRIGYGECQAWNGAGPYDLTFHRDRITGRHTGLGRVLCLTEPAGLDRYATVTVDGIPYLPGSSITTDPAIAGRAGKSDSEGRPVLVIPLLEGEHAVELRNLEQPPVFRNWQQW